MASLVTLLILASSLDRGVLRPVLQAASPQFKRCFETAGPEVSGKTRLTLTVLPNGTVFEVEVEFPLVAPDFTHCLHDVALKLRFHRGPAMFRLIWPIVFKRT